VRLLPIAMLEHDKVECIKLEEQRGCSFICTGLVGQGPSTSLCIACKRTVYVYELNCTKQRCRRVKEVTCPAVIQYVVIYNERLCVGYPSSFAIYSILNTGDCDGAPVGKLQSCKQCVILTSMHFMLSTFAGIGPLPGGLTNCCPLVVCHCWLGHLTRKNRPQYDL